MKSEIVRMFSPIKQQNIMLTVGEFKPSIVDSMAKIYIRNQIYNNSLNNFFLSNIIKDYLKIEIVTLFIKNELRARKSLNF